MDFKKRVKSWLEEKIKLKAPIEVVSFYDEIPVRVKLLPTSTEDFKVVGWKSNPKIIPAVEQTQKFYVNFSDSETKEIKILSCSVFYYNSSYMETAFPTFEIDPRFDRDSVRVTVSSKVPVHADIRIDDSSLSLKVVDISEGGVGILIEKDILKENRELVLDLKINDTVLTGIKGKVVYIGDISGDKKFEKVGISFPNLNGKYRNAIARYLMQRQREIINEVKMLIDD